MKHIRTMTGMTQKEFAEYFNIPVRTLQDWEGKRRNPPQYLVELIKYKIENEKEKLNMKKENAMKNQFEILDVKEQNHFFDSRKSNNGGGYHQPFIEFQFNGITGWINDTSCGEFGERFSIVFNEKEYKLNTMEQEAEEYSSFSEKCLEDKLLSKHLKEVGYPICFKENLEE